MSTEKTTITIEAHINAPAQKVWSIWTNPEDITKWNTPSPEWHTPRAEHDLKPGGAFTYHMEARDGSMGFDFGGVFNVVTPNEYLEYTIGDGRKVKINFNADGEKTHIVEAFEAESENPVDMQRDGWQAILNSFKSYTEAQN